MAKASRFQREGQGFEAYIHFIQRMHGGADGSSHQIRRN